MYIIEELFRYQFCGGRGRQATVFSVGWVLGFFCLFKLSVRKERNGEKISLFCTLSRSAGAVGGETPW